MVYGILLTYFNHMKIPGPDTLRQKTYGLLGTGSRKTVRWLPAQARKHRFFGKHEPPEVP